MYEQISSADLCLWPLQRHRPRTMGNEPWNIWVLCKSYLTLGPRASACFCSSSLHVGQQGVPTRGLCTSPRTTVFSPLQQTFHFMLKSQIGLELHDMNHPYCQNSQMLQDLVLSSQGFVALPCQMKPVLPASSFTQIPAEEDSLTPNCWTVPSQFCIFLPPQGKVFVSLLSQCF